MTDNDTSTASFEQFVREETTGLLRLARLLAGPDAAEDLVQESLIKMLRHWRRVRDANDPRAYARRSLVNEFLSARRRRTLDYRPLEDDAPAVDESSSVVLERMTLRDVLAELPVRQRTAVVLRYYLGLSHAEIGDAMGLEESTARSLVSRGMTALRRTVRQPDHSTEWMQP